MNHKIKPNKGVTLLELLVAVAITVVVGGSILGALYSGRSAFDSGGAITYRNEKARAVLDLIYRDIVSAHVFPVGTFPDPIFYYGPAEDFDSFHGDYIVDTNNFKYESDNFYYNGEILQQNVLFMTALIDSDFVLEELKLIGYFLIDSVLFRYEHSLRTFQQASLEMIAENITHFDMEFTDEHGVKQDPNVWDMHEEDVASSQRGKLPSRAQIIIEVTDRNHQQDPERFHTTVYIPMSSRPAVDVD